MGEQTGAAPLTSGFQTCRGLAILSGNESFSGSQVPARPLRSGPACSPALPRAPLDLGTTARKEKSGSPPPREPWSPPSLLRTLPSAWGTGSFPSTSEEGGHLRGGGHRGEGLIKEASVWEAREKMLTQTSEFQKRVKSAEMGHLF